MQFILPLWLLRLARILFLAELELQSRLRKTSLILAGGLLIFFSPETAAFFGFDLLAYSPPLLELSNRFLYIPSALLASIYLNIATLRILNACSIKERWKQAVIECRLISYDHREYKRKLVYSPSIVQIRRNYFRVLAGGYTAEDFDAKRKQLSNALGVFIWGVREAIGRRGSRQVGCVDFFYTRQDLPAQVPLKAAQPPRKFQFNVGLSVKGFEFITFQKFIHGGIAGATGKGKSVMLRSLVTQILAVNPESFILGIDFKMGSEFHFFGDLQHNFITSYDYETTALALGEIIELYKERAELVKRYQVENFYQLTGEGIAVLPVFVIVDEAAELLSPLPFKGSSQKDIRNQEKITRDLTTIARVSRFVGIHLILATQRPDASTIPPQLRGQLATRLIAKVNQREDSVLWLNRKDALELPDIPGRFLLATEAGKFEEIQGLYLSKQEAREYLSRIAPAENPIYERISRNLRAAESRRKSPANNPYETSMDFKN